MLPAFLWKCKNKISFKVNYIILEKGTLKNDIKDDVT